MENPKRDVTFTEEQQAQLISLRQHYPYRIVWGAFDPDGNFLTGADTTRCQINKMARLGYRVFVVEVRSQEEKHGKGNARRRGHAQPGA